MPRLSEQIRVDLDIDDNNKNVPLAHSLLKLEFPTNQNSVFDFDLTTCS